MVAPGPDTTATEAADPAAFVAAVAPLVRSLAAKLAARLRGIGVDADDLAQEGLIAAWRMAPRYDPALASPAAFVFRRVSGAMVDYVRGVHEERSRRVVRDAAAGRGPKIVPLCRVLRRHDRTSAGRATLRDQLSLTVPAAVPSDDPAAELVAAVRRLGVDLTAQDREALRLRFGDGLLSREVGRRLGVSESRASQILTGVCDRVRDALAAAGRNHLTAFA